MEMEMEMENWGLWWALPGGPRGVHHAIPEWECWPRVGPHGLHQASPLDPVLVLLDMGCFILGIIIITTFIIFILESQYHRYGTT